MTRIITCLCYFILLTQQPNFCRIPHLYQLTKPFDHAEGPTWDNRKGLLYFVDIHSGNLHSFDLFAHELNTIHLNGDVSVVIPSKTDPDVLIVAVNRTLCVIEWDGKSKFYKRKDLTRVSEQFPTSRFNDGKADLHGRLWLGTMGFENSSGVQPNQGLLYKITPSNIKNPEVLIAPVNISNGLTWNKENTKFYYIDSPSRRIIEYEFNRRKGLIRKRREIFDLKSFKNIGGYPDGMTIDRGDNLWVALYGGGAIIKVNPRNGKLLQVVAIPAEAVTSVMFGGPNLDVLFVTTSRFRLSRKQRLRQPAAGSVFVVRGLGTTGREIYKADIVDIV